MDPNFIAAGTRQLAEQYLAIEKEADAERLNKAQN